MCDHATTLGFTATQYKKAGAAANENDARSVAAVQTRPHDTGLSNPFKFNATTGHALARKTASIDTRDQGALRSRKARYESCTLPAIALRLASSPSIALACLRAAATRSFGNAASLPPGSLGS